MYTNTTRALYLIMYPGLGSIAQVHFYSDRVHTCRRCLQHSTSSIHFLLLQHDVVMPLQSHAPPVTPGKQNTRLRATYFPPSPDSFILTSSFGREDRVLPTFELDSFSKWSRVVSIVQTALGFRGRDFTSPYPRPEHRRRSMSSVNHT